jgi:hypothetical protein
LAPIACPSAFSLFTRALVLLLEGTYNYGTAVVFDASETGKDSSFGVLLYFEDGERF